MCRVVVLAAVSGLAVANARAEPAATRGASSVPMAALGWGDVTEARDVAVTRNETTAGGLRLAVTGERPTYAWATIAAPAEGWDLERRATVEADVTNRGTSPATVHLWVEATRGWVPVGDVAVVARGATRHFACDLRRTFPDGTPMLDPARVSGVRVLLEQAPRGAAIDVSPLVATGELSAWTPPAGRIEVPVVEDGPPAAGRRVRHMLGAAAVGGLLHLPDDWRPGGRYPVIVEFPGNVFFTAGCHSTGLPEQCVIGYGMSQGRGAIWLSLPFVDRAGGVAIDGWGDPDATADLCKRMVDDVCTRFGGDRNNVVLTGFSRGAIACGFIGLRDDAIAGLWKGFHLCQHFDGDGWRGATLDGALERARRFRGVAVFHTDNAAARVRPVTDALGVPTTFASSGLGAHATAMFLDDRESTRRLRHWFIDLVGG